MSLLLLLISKSNNELIPGNREIRAGNQENGIFGARIKIRRGFLRLSGFLWLGKHVWNKINADSCIGIHLFFIFSSFFIFFIFFIAKKMKSAVFQNLKAFCSLSWCGNALRNLFYHHCSKKVSNSYFKFSGLCSSCRAESPEKSQKR